jgi:hypothetical protein
MLVNKMDQTFKVARPDLAQLLAAAKRSDDGLADSLKRNSLGQSGSDREE